MRSVAPDHSSRKQRGARCKGENDPIRPVVYVVDDDQAARDALHTLLETVSLEARCFADAESFLASWETRRPGCLILDLRLPQMGGLEVQTWLQERGVDLPIIFVTAHGNISTAVRAMRLGAMQFMTKPFDEDELLEWVRNGLRLDAKWRRERLQRESVRSRLETLTPREREILDRMLAAHSTKKIARELGISGKTVDVHRSNIKAKMDVHSTLYLTHLCINAGVLTSRNS